MVGVVFRGVVIDVHAVLPLKAKHFEPVLVAPGCTVEAFDDSALREGGIVSDGHRYGSAGAGQGDVLCSRRELGLEFRGPGVEEFGEAEERVVKSRSPRGRDLEVAQD